MKRPVKSIIGFTISATDGEIGTVKDLFFDDETWTVRYLVVETGSWLVERKVLLSPQSLLTPNWEDETFPVNLTREQVKSSPDIDTEQPVTRQDELKLYSHYPWNNYWEGNLWAGGIGTTGMMMPVAAPLEDAIANEMHKDEQIKEGDPHLRSTGYMKGYALRATDKSIGEVEDFIIDDKTWKVSYLVIDTGNWLPGKKVIISPDWITKIEWELSAVTIDHTSEMVKNSPEYNPDNMPDESYEQQLHSHYGG